MPSADEQTNTPTNSRLIPLTKWNDYYPWPPLGGLRHLVFHSRTNGFSKVVRRIGRTVLLDENAFHAWVREQNGDHDLEPDASGS